MISNITRTLGLIATVFTLGQAIAAEPVKINGSLSRSSQERMLDRALNRHLSFPLFEKGDMTGEVYVSFVIDTEGKVAVLECNSSNPRLKDYVMRKLAKVDIGDNPDGIWKRTHMKISFRPEST